MGSRRLNKKYQRLRRRHMSRSVNRSNSLSSLNNLTTTLLFRRVRTRLNNRLSLNRVATRLRRMRCPHTIHLTINEMLIRIAFTGIMVSNCNKMPKIPGLLSREVAVLLVHLQLSRDLSMLPAKLNSPLNIDSVKQAKLKPAATRHRTPLYPVNNSRVNHTKCCSSRLKARLEASMEDIPTAIHIMVILIMPHMRANSK